ncbi:hypothetical protein A0H81_07207 [Grifola frondosa]|uniref:Uncharacterized protein n=1 Tax=Grifola frondosa TaxID=5627 RepID=A0A1C7MDD0_GRIFR|nr:hypothetical protein A0H81_07207 [Grifola frondosa]
MSCKEHVEWPLAVRVWGCLESWLCEWMDSGYGQVEGRPRIFLGFDLDLSQIPTWTIRGDRSDSETWIPPPSAVRWFPSQEVTQYSPILPYT